MSDQVPLPDDQKRQQVRDAMRGLREEAGLPPAEGLENAGIDLYVGKGDSRPLPQVLVTQLADILRRSKKLFRHGSDLKTVNEGTGEMDKMTAHRFVTWLPNTVGVVCHAGKKIDPATGTETFQLSSMSIEQASLMLASHELQTLMPEIKTVNLVPMPVFRKRKDDRGLPALEWLGPGYDAQTKSFTVHGCPVIDHSLDGMEAAQEIFDLLKWFDWSDKDPETGVANRMAAHVAAMVTALARYLYTGKAPFFLYQSNLEGSGKGALIKFAMKYVFRTFGAANIDFRDKPELKKTLNTKARAGDQYAFFDELPEDLEIRDQLLAAWLTEETWEFRGMGQDDKIAKPDITKVITIGAVNRGRVNRNIGRRTVFIDLQPHQEAKERKLPANAVKLDSDFFNDTARLDRLLNCVAAMIRLWDEQGRPRTKDREIESFEVWSHVVPSIVETAGLGRALVPFEAPGSGDDDSRMMHKLARAVIDTFCFETVTNSQTGRTERKSLEAATVSMREIVRTARVHGLFVERLGTVEMVYEMLKQRKHTWRDVEEVVQEEMLGGQATTRLREPNEKEKLLQAAEFLDSKGDMSGSTWGKHFAKLAPDNRYFTSSCGVVYKFGERGASKVSRFVLRRQRGV